jgi:hypothetical protein
MHVLNIATHVLLLVALCLLVGRMVRVWLRNEVGTAVDRKLEHEIRRSRATHVIQDELRRTSKAMIDAALNITVEDDMSEQD